VIEDVFVLKHYFRDKGWSNVCSSGESKSM
jgi:hypothetical protein